MKRIIQSLVVAALVSTAQASPFPVSAEASSSPPVEWTYADRHEPNTLAGTIPGGGDVVGQPAQSSYAEEHANEPRTLMGSAIPEDAEAFPLQAQSTYADRFATEAVKQAGAMEAAALSE